MISKRIFNFTLFSAIIQYNFCNHVEKIYLNVKPRKKTEKTRLCMRDDQTSCHKGFSNVLKFDLNMKEEN